MRRLLAIILLIQLVPPAAWGWGARVHRTLTYLALDGLPAEAPGWLRDPDFRHRAAFQSSQPDRWRGWPSDVLKHANEPEHYLDVEALDEFGLTLETVPKLRGEYLRALAVAKHVHPENVAPYDAGKDPARTKEWPGFVLQAAAEDYAKLQAAFNQVRILEKLNDPDRQFQLEQARAIVLYHLGDLAHFVADIAQPLHTTKHHNGWAGDNPAGYKWRDRFHSYIDEGFADKHGVGYESLKPRVKYEAKVDAANPWNDLVGYLARSHAQVEPLYTLERDGQLDGADGRALIEGRLTDATTMLSALIWAAYTSAAPTEKQVEAWLRYNALDARRLPPEAPATTQPALRQP